MYVVTKEKTAWIDIEWIALDEEGFQETNKITMKVVLCDADRFKQLTDAITAPVPDFNPFAFIQEVSRDWGEILGPDKKAFPFTPDNLDIVAKSSGFVVGWHTSYMRGWLGQGKIREKNSASSPAAGRAGTAKPKRQARKSS